MSIMNIRILCMSAIAFLVFGCSGSGIVPIGKDTYMSSKPGGFFTWSGGEVKAELYREGHEYCKSQGKEFMPVSSSAKDSGYARPATAELHFRCLVENDPELIRPTMEQIPDVKIEMNAK
jgi:hypothetical protein